jgi:hypothetical protein
MIEALVFIHHCVSSFSTLPVILLVLLSYLHDLILHFELLMSLFNSLPSCRCVSTLSWF